MAPDFATWLRTHKIEIQEVIRAELNTFDANSFSKLNPIFVNDLMT